MTVKRSAMTLWVAFSLGLFMAASADATVREWLMERAGLDPDLVGSAPSVRLRGMGDVGLAVPDESNELNAHDFGGNVAGLLADADGWVVESWMGSSKLAGTLPTLSSERSYGNAGTQITQRSDSRALGVEVNWTYFETDHSPGDWARVRGPLMSGILNQRFGDFTLGAIVGRESENESRHSDDYFSLQHSQSRWIGQVGAVEGTSVDPGRFHEDTFEWSRPVDRFSVALLLPAGQAVEGGVRASFMDRKGGEICEVSWSAESPENPSHVNYSAEDITTFHETETDTDLQTRWRLHLGGGMILGLEAGMETWEIEVVEGTNYKGSQRSGAWTRDVQRGGAALSQRLLDRRLLVAIQAVGLRADLEASDELGRTEQTMEGAKATAGIEYFYREDLAFRSGFYLSSVDRDTDAPLSISNGHGFHLGMSWLPRGGTIQVHGAVSQSWEEPEDNTAPDVEDQDETSFLVGMRLLL